MIDKIFFLVVDNDDHREPIYAVYSDKQVALDLARRLSDGHKKEYGDMPAYITPCNGSAAWWFYEYGEERWGVSVRELKYKCDDNHEA